jgi:hypothetical protein
VEDVLSEATGLVSVVIPMYNERAAIGAGLVAGTRQAAGRLQQMAARGKG